MEKCLDTFVISSLSRPILTCSHWWEFVFIECRHSVILRARTHFEYTTQKVFNVLCDRHWPYVLGMGDTLVLDAL